MIKKIDRYFLTDGHRIAPLDGLRTIAISVVILRHCFDRPLGTFELNSFLSLLLGFGWVGVPLFFSLSGFLIGGMIYSKLRQNQFSFGEFYFNRTLRILPIAYVMMILSRPQLIGWNWETFCNFAYLSNIFPVIAFQDHFWSLCVEEQFYFVFPCVLFLAYKYCRKSGLGILLLLLIVIFSEWLLRAFFLYQSEHGVAYAYTASQYQIDFLLVGVIAALLYHHKSEWSGVRKIAAICRFFTPFLPLCYVAIAYLIAPMNQKLPVHQPFSYAIGYPLIATACFFSVFGVIGQANWVTRILSAPVFRWIAAMSYSMYIFHIWVINNLYAVPKMLAQLMPNHPNLVALISIPTIYVLIVAVSFVTFSLIEKPCLALRSKVLKRLKATPSLTKTS